QRALGDRQLEARQLADRQRELASELERLPAPGDGTKDAMRRIAAEQERLAGRARRLRQALQDQTADRNDPGEHKGANAAGSDLHRLAEQMQQSADQMRGAIDADRGTPAAGLRRDPRSQASIQREFARRLDRLADGLNPAAAKDDE